MAAVLCLGGLAIVATSTCELTYAVGVIMVESGKGGMFLVAMVVVSDSSDLRWRSLCMWSLHFTLSAWSYLSPHLENLISDRINISKTWYDTQNLSESNRVANCHSMQAHINLVSFRLHHSLGFPDNYSTLHIHAPGKIQGLDSSV